MGSLFKPLVWNWGFLTVTPFGFLFALGLISYLFLVWRRFRQEYPEEEVINFSLLTLLAFLSVGRLVYGLSHWSDWRKDPFSWLLFWQRGGFSFWGGGVGAVLAAVLFCQKKKWKVEYWLEGATLPFLIATTLSGLGLFLTTGKAIFLARIFALLLTILAVVLLSGYRSFTWYPSGKPGFLFLVALIILLLFEGGLDFYLTHRLYWRSILSWVGAGGAGVTLYFLAQKK